MVSRRIPTVLKLVPIVLWNIRLAIVLLENRFDVVYCASDPLGSPSVWAVSKLKRNRTVFEAHAIYSEESKEVGNKGIRLKLDQTLEKFVATHSDFVVTLSQNSFEFYHRYTSRIDTVPVFVDTDLFLAEVKPRRMGRRLIGLIGPFDAPSGRQRSCLEFLLRRIRDFDSRIDFVVIGRCENRIENERITYTGFLDSAKDYVARLCALDAVLVAEGTATYGPLNKVLEPMSCSIPVFTTPKGMVGLYWVEAGKDIFVFEEDELVDRINELIFDEELMRRVGQSARNVVEKYYSKRANERKLMSILESVLSA